MGRCYDNWERLVNAVMLREQLRQLSLENSRSPSMTSLDSDYSFSSSLRLDESSFETTPSPLHPDDVKVARNVRGAKQSGGGRKVLTIWRGLSIFRAFMAKKEYDKDGREFKWARARRTSHGLRPPTVMSPFNEMGILKDHAEIKRKARIGAEIERLRDVHTLKGHVEALVKLKGLDINTIRMHYTV